MKRMFKKFMTMAMAAAMVLGMATVVGATDAKADDAVTKCIEITVKNADKAKDTVNGYYVNTWNGASLGDQTKVSSKAYVSDWGESQVVVISDNKFMLTYDYSSNEKIGLQIVAYKDGGQYPVMDWASNSEESYEPKLNSANALATLMKDASVKTIVAELDYDGAACSYTVSFSAKSEAPADSNGTTTPDAPTATVAANATAAADSTAKADAPAATATAAATTTVEDDVTPKTADTAQIMLFAALGVISLAGVVFAVRKKTA